MLVKFAKSADTVVASKLLPKIAAVRYADPIQDALILADSVVMGRPCSNKSLPFDVNTGMSLCDSDYPCKVCEYLGGGRTRVYYNAERAIFPMKLSLINGMNSILLAECYLHAHCLLQEALWLFENFLSDEHPLTSDRFKSERSYIYPEDGD